MDCAESWPSPIWEWMDCARLGFWNEWIVRDWDFGMNGYVLDWEFGMNGYVLDWEFGMNGLCEIGSLE